MEAVFRMPDFFENVNTQCRHSLTESRSIRQVSQPSAASNLNRFERRYVAWQEAMVESFACWSSVVEAYRARCRRRV